MNIKTLILGVIFVASVTAHDFYERWIIPSSSKEQFLKTIAPYSVEAINRAGIEVVFSEMMGKYSPVAVVSRPIEGERVLVWEDKAVSVYLPKTLINPCDLEVELKKEAGSIFEVTPEEMVKIHDVIARVRKAFQSQFGVCDYLVDFEHGCEKNRNHFVARVVGAHPEHLGDYYLLNHLWALLTFFDVELEPPKELEIEKWNTSEYRERLANIFKEAMVRDKDPGRVVVTDPAKFSWDQRTIMAGAEHELIADALFSTLVKQKIPIERGKSKYSSSLDELKVNRKLGCAFCKPSNAPHIEDQTIYDDGFVRLMLNQSVYLPDGHYGHFIVTPKEHKTDFEDLTPEEIRKMHMLRQILVKVLVEKFGWKGYGNSLCQNGGTVGRTVPHVHDKMENNTDNIVTWLLFCLTYDNVEKISDEEMRRATKEIKNAIVEELERGAIATGTGE